jgi:hypothetical protein
MTLVALVSPRDNVWTRVLINTGLQPGGVLEAVSTAFGRVILGSEEMQRHVRFIADDPAIVGHRRNVKQIAGVKLSYATIIERDCRRPRENKADMFNGTTGRTNTRTDVLAPFPPWLIRRTTNCDSAEMN